MLKNQELDRIAITARSHKLLNRFLDENPDMESILRNARDETEALDGVKNWVLDGLHSSPDAIAFFKESDPGRRDFKKLKWRDLAAIRVLDYVDNAGREFEDLNLRGELVVSNPIRMIWMAVHNGTGGAKPQFFTDMLHLFRQFRDEERHVLPDRGQVEKWMGRFPSGLDPKIVELREENRNRIINKLIDGIDCGEMSSARFRFDDGLSREQKFQQMNGWWDDWRFHQAFAIRDPDLLNKMLDDSLDPDTMDVLHNARDAGIPFFVNPYYLSLLFVKVPDFAPDSDLTIRQYVFYSRNLVDEFGHIVAWEKEDQVRPGEPNAAGWLLPSAHSVHRRYPEVAILIPETVGRACGGLCAACQRMFDFQNGNLNFDLDKLKPNEKWPDRLARYMEYFEKDSQLRDILITGGDALMSSDKSLSVILDAVLGMAERKKEANRDRPDGKKFAELTRIRLGTRMPVYVPQRITPSLSKVLADFKSKASGIGVRQFVIQTHFESPLEVTPEAERAIGRMLDSGWTVTNQLVFTPAASRRGHTTKLRQVLNDVGVLTYYTFTTKGYMENKSLFAPNARAVQEQLEEKVFGRIPKKHIEAVRDLPLQAENLKENIDKLRMETGLPFLATDRNVLNLPGVGKSMTFRVIGITRYGRRILEFDHDKTRMHSPIIEKMGKVVIIESKSITEYLEQLNDLGEDVSDYEGLYGYSIGVTEPRMPLYEVSDYDFEVTDEVTNLDLGA